MQLVGLYSPDFQLVLVQMEGLPDVVQVPERLASPNHFDSLVR